MQVSDYPERPGQPECSYFMKTGECKYKVTCKFHHPKSRINKVSPSVLSDKGLPLRPDQNICSHYSRYGICKYGPACKYDHPVNYSNSIPAGQGYQSDGPVMQQSEARRAAEKEYDATTKMDENVNNVVISSNRAARVAAIKAVQKQMHQRRNSDELPISMV